MKPFPIFIFLLFYQISSAQIQDKVDFKQCVAEIYVEPNEKKISGSYHIQFLAVKDVDSIFLDAHNMSFDELKITKDKVYESTEVKIKTIVQNNKLIVKGRFKKDEFYTLEFEYKTNPRQTVYFLGWDDNDPSNDQIWTQGQGKYTSHWLPSLDDMNDKIEFDLNFVLKEDLEVISNGRLLKKDTLPDSKAYVWKFDMQKPMSSYLVAFAIGNFDKEILQSTSGVPIELYHEPRDSSKVEPTYRYTKQIFDFLENEIGVPYPWQNYKQIPVHDFLYAGMENTGATIFSNTFVVDSTAFIDKNYVNVNAHELAHQWFGNMVTEQSGEHHWLHEGFATYYAYLTEKELFGEDYFYWKLYETATSLNNFSKDGNGEALTNPNAGSLTFYEKGAWALVMLRERVGDEAFKEGIRNYLQKFAYQNVTISDFMWEMRKASGMKLMDFEQIWLQDSEFHMDLVENYLLTKSKSLEAYFIIKQTKENSADNLVNAMLNKYWDINKSSHFKRQVVIDFVKDISEEKWVKMVEKEEIKVRQALALSVPKISATLKPVFESMLNDESYVTQEAALFKLWSDFPEDRSNYLEKTSGTIGLPNKNVKLLWLALALATPAYKNEQKRAFYDELSGYTHPKYHFEVRLLAFQYLNNLDAFSDEALKNLINACNHHVWYFKKSCRTFLKGFLKGEGNRDRLKTIYVSLNQQEKEYLDKTLGK
ncbi:M1 family metallopeptidase [Flagellimonas meridianipacifica]|uniref:Aminopeptidase N n=1 Tax=Flagellimonas meridianipacifica TaxID=1080225 RepID=A0A2T0MB40_9FLAO|nr:M1 family metallopeptidase [Allomuricauda pacifica]PRX54724.1 aminopeptidase N [Allomuricauda pacifica]